MTGSGERSPIPTALLALYNTTMSYPCLAEFLEELAQEGQLVRVEAAVDPVLEAPEITRRLAQKQGPAILFGAPKGHEIPLLTNLLSTPKRICRALKARSLDEVAERVADAILPSQPEGRFERLRAASGRTPWSKLGAKTVRTGASQQVVRLGNDVDLSELPVPQSAVSQSNRAITAAQLFTVDAQSGRPHVGRYDLHVLDSDRLAAGWHPCDEPAQLLAEYGRLEKRMPVAVAAGGDPASLLAAMAPLPSEADVSTIAGFFRGQPRQLVEGRTTDLLVPADAEIVLEGYLDPSEPPADVGTIVTPSGYCNRSRPAPVIHVTAMTHRANPIFPSMVPGTPPHEACVIHGALGRVFLPLVRAAIPGLVDYDLPMFGAARHWAFLSVRKTYAGQARQVALAAWGLKQLMFSRIMVIVGEEVDVHSYDEVWSAVTAHVHPGRDVFLQQGPNDPSDPTAPPDELSHRMALDATKKLPEERGGWSSGTAETGDETRELVTRMWEEYGFGAEDAG